MRKGFTLVEIMIVVAVLGLLVAIGVPGFLNARNKSRLSVELANLKSINDNISLYGVNTGGILDNIQRLWPSSSTICDAGSYIRKQLHCPIVSTGYSLSSSLVQGSCNQHGEEVDARTIYG